MRNYFQNTGDFARVCYESDGDAEKIGEHCIGAGHWPPARAVYFLFKVEGMARILTQQVCRHHVGVEFAQKSQRYCDESSPSIVIPDSILHHPEALEEFIALQNMVYKTYRKLASLGIPMDDARFSLTNATASDFNIGLTPQALVHLCHERRCNRASWQTHEMADKMAALVRDVEPRFTDLLVAKCDALGYCPEKQSCGKRPKKAEIFKVYETWGGVAKSAHVATVNLGTEPHKPWKDNEV